MIVLKRNIKKENFDISKIERSIKNSAKDINLNLSNSDIKIICEEVSNTLFMLRGFKGVTTSYEIQGTVIKWLKEYKFDMIIPSYLNLI